MKEPTAMRLAFEKAWEDRPQNTHTTVRVKDALRRGVGLIPRKQMWSVTRGKR